MDDRGLWLQVGNGIRGIHVNGRPVRRMALLRAGDAVYVDGVEMVLQGEVESLLQAPAPKNEDGSDEQQRLLRGVGGLHHGRSFTLSQARLIGRGNEADIAIDDPAFAEQHARVEVHGERVLLRDLAAPTVPGSTAWPCATAGCRPATRSCSMASTGSCWKCRTIRAAAARRGRRQPRGRAGAGAAGRAAQGPALAVAAGECAAAGRTAQPAALVRRALI